MITFPVVDDSDDTGKSPYRPPLIVDLTASGETDGGKVSFATETTLPGMNGPS